MDELRHLAGQRFGDMVKGVVDLRRRVLRLDAELHADQEADRSRVVDDPVIREAIASLVHRLVQR